MKLKRSPLVSKGSLDRIFKSVNEAWKRLDFQTAIELLERASRLNPSNAGIFLDLGRMYGVRHDYAAAERCFEWAARVAPNKSEVLVAAGQQCRDFSNFNMAENFLKRAVEQKDASPAAIVKLAEVCERLRRAEESSALVDRALLSNARFAPALLLRSKLDRQAGRLDAAEKLLRAFPADAEETLRVNAAYELGGILDRKGRYDEAMAAFLQAKTLQLQKAAPHLAELKIVRQRIQVMQSNLTAETLQRWFDNAPALTPVHKLTLLGGHPRSGTTLLEQVLDSHPGIMSVEETTIFHDEAYMPLTRGLPDDTPMLSVLEAAQTSALQQSRANYFDSVEKFLVKNIGNRLLIDKNPSLTFLIPLLIRIFPEIKLLVMIRDPRDVVLSCFMQSIPLSQGSAAYLTLENTVEEYASMMRLWQTLASLIKNSHLEVRYEDMVDDLEAVARRTLDFLNVPWDDRVLGFDEHARQKLVRSPTYADVTQKVYKRARGRWRNYQKYLEPYLEMLEPFVKAFGYE